MELGPPFAWEFCGLIGSAVTSQRAGPAAAMVAKDYPFYLTVKRANCSLEVPPASSPAKDAEVGPPPGPLWASLTLSTPSLCHCFPSLTLCVPLSLSLSISHTLCFPVFISNSCLYLIASLPPPLYGSKERHLLCPHLFAPTSLLHPAELTDWIHSTEGLSHSASVGSVVREELPFKSTGFLLQEVWGRAGEHS